MILLTILLFRHQLPTRKRMRPMKHSFCHWSFLRYQLISTTSFDKRGSTASNATSSPVTFPRLNSSFIAAPTEAVAICIRKASPSPEILSPSPEILSPDTEFGSWTRSGSQIWILDLIRGRWTHVSEHLFGRSNSIIKSRRYRHLVLVMASGHACSQVWQLVPCDGTTSRRRMEMRRRSWQTRPFLLRNFAESSC